MNKSQFEEYTVFLKCFKAVIGDAAFSPQGLFPHIIFNRDSGIEPYHPALYYGRYVHAEGKFPTVGT